MMRRRLQCYIAAIALVASCKDPAGPGAEATPLPAEVGTYDLTAVLTSFQFETTYTECPPYVGQLYCFFENPFDGATLSGTLVIGPTFSETQGWIVLTDVHGSFTGQFCSSWSSGSGCKAVKDTSATYSGVLKPTYLSLPPRVEIMGGAGHLNLYGFTVTADSAAGRVFWSLSPPGRWPAGHWGTFIARKRH
jgi:hypothetical protein